MGVFEKNSADPFRDRKEKHVVAESRRPIRDGETDAFARDHSAAANEKERGDDREPGEAMQPVGAAVVIAAEEGDDIEPIWPGSPIRLQLMMSARSGWDSARRRLAWLGVRLPRWDSQSSGRPEAVLCPESARQAVLPADAGRERSDWEPESSARSFSHA